MRWACFGLVFGAVSGVPQRAVVIGGGVGGLYSAAKLARSGVDVTLVEKNSRAAAGGRLACETICTPDGRRFRFETGPSLLLLPSVYREALTSLGIKPEEHLDLVRCCPSYAVHFADGGPTPLEIGGDAQQETGLKVMMEAVEPGSYIKYTEYLKSARANLRAGLPIFIREQLGSDELATLPDFLRCALLGGGFGSAGGSLTLLRDWPLSSHARQLVDLFEAPRHRELGAFQDLYVLNCFHDPDARYAPSGLTSITKRHATPAQVHWATPA
jgi:phytoene dehydrogenase-like protein